MSIIIKSTKYCISLWYVYFSLHKYKYNYIRQYDIRVGILKCEIILQDLIKRHDDDLNLKTPSGPQPHPSWVYRHNYAPFHSVARTATSTSTGGTGAAAINVKRSLSFLKSSSGSSTLLKSQESSTGKPLRRRQSSS